MRIFRVAIAGSLFAHLIFALVVHSKPVKAAPEPKPDHMYLITLPKATPTPQPPKPKTKPQHTSSTAIHRLPVNLVKQTNANPHGPAQIVASALPGTPEPRDLASPGPDVTGPPATETPSPPTPTPKPACSAPDVAARAIDTITPETPEDSDANGAQAKVRVDLDANGAVTGVSVYQSSGDQRLDSAAMRAARASRYAPELRDCKDVPGSYLFTVDFSGE